MAFSYPQAARSKRSGDAPNNGSGFKSGFCIELIGGSIWDVGRRWIVTSQRQSYRAYFTKPMRKREASTQRPGRIRCGLFFVSWKIRLLNRRLICYSGINSVR